VRPSASLDRAMGNQYVAQKCPNFTRPIRSDAGVQTEVLELPDRPTRKLVPNGFWEASNPLRVDRRPIGSWTAASGIASEEPRSVSPQVRDACLQDRGRETGLSYSGPTRAKCGKLTGLPAENAVAFTSSRPLDAKT
jgi:hypothetical protein